MSSDFIFTLQMTYAKKRKKYIFQNDDVPFLVRLDEFFENTTYLKKEIKEEIYEDHQN